MGAANSLELPEDSRFRLECASLDHPGEGVERFYFNGVSTLQALRVLGSETSFELVVLEVPVGEGAWISATDAPPLATVGEAVQWFLSLLTWDDLINFECRVGRTVRMHSHDDMEVTLEGPRNGEARAWAVQLLTSRGFDAGSVIEQMDRHAEKMLAVRAPALVLGVYDSFDAYLAAHPE